MLFDELNTYQRTIREGVDLASMSFKPIKDYVGQVIYVDGFFFTDGKYGKQVVVVGNGAKINLPSRYVEKFEKILNTKHMLDAVLDGRMVLKDIEESKTRNGTTVTFRFDVR